MSTQQNKLKRKKLERKFWKKVLIIKTILLVLVFALMWIAVSRMLGLIA